MKPTASTRHASLVLFAAASAILASLGACERVEPNGYTNERTAAAQAPITGACTPNTFGYPCDPDGAGPLSECEGICSLSVAGDPACVSLAAAGLPANHLNGRVCGDANGSDCSKSCDDGACKNKNATVGSACAVLGGNGCSGQCTLLLNQVVCELALAGCPAMHRDGCKFQACNFENNSNGCVSTDLLSGTTCNDGNKCTTADTCNGTGSCIGGSPVQCAAGCSCDPNSGSCVGSCGTTSSTSATGTGSAATGSAATGSGSGTGVGGASGSSNAATGGTQSSGSASTASSNPSGTGATGAVGTGAGAGGASSAEAEVRGGGCSVSSANSAEGTALTIAAWGVILIGRRRRRGAAH